MRTSILMALGAMALATTTAANATAFVGTTGGCFGVACTPTTGTVALAGTGLSYTSGGFNQSDSNGFVGIGSGSGNDNLGTFTLLPTAGTTNFNNPFTLLVSFTSPAALSGTYFSTVLGSVTDSNAGGIQVDFDNTPRTFGSGSGAFTLTVNDTAVSNDGVATPVTGFIRTAVPEPATWAMMLMGFTGIGFAMRRRRQPRLAQLA
jgi:hypothetical protein